MHKIRFHYILILLLITLGMALGGRPAMAENIDPDDDGSQYAYGENAGWLNAEPSGDGGPGVEVGDTALTGYIWAENVGWVSLSCLNTSSCATVSYGVTNDGAGVLGGYAWGENVGWLSFSCANTGSCGTVDYGVTIDTATGDFSGRAWGENTGWVTFRSTGAVPYKVKTGWVGVVQYTLTIDGAGTGSGTVVDTGINCTINAGVTSGDCTEPYDEGTVVTLTATADAGSVFSGWSGGSCTGTGQCVVTMNADITVTATFTQQYDLTVNINPAGGGTVTGTGISCPGDCTETYDSGTDVILTATPNTGYAFTSWTNCDTPSGNQCTMTMNSGKTVTAQFYDDGDGVNPEIEDSAPNGGDGNNDGTLDSLQPDVTSLPSATGQGYITMVTSGGCSQNQNVQTFTETPDDPDYSYPYGLIGFSLPCENGTVEIIYHGAADLTGYEYRKYGPTTPGNAGTTQWYDFSSYATVNGNRVTLSLQDNRLGDDTGDDGVIVDQGGPGQQSAVVAVPTMTEWGMIIFMLLAGLGAVWAMRKDSRE